MRQEQPSRQAESAGASGLSQTDVVSYYVVLLHRLERIVLPLGLSAKEFREFTLTSWLTLPKKAYQTVLWTGVAFGIYDIWKHGAGWMEFGRAALVGLPLGYIIALFSRHTIE